ncbi:hypothetical protein DFH11DRAFT_490556 [Phellopilus nigrolimitatus]|nr:hypothetical protein DFH11DRAFT_490556 [Phellopilus nigrolimitatus]
MLVSWMLTADQKSTLIVCAVRVYRTRPAWRSALLRFWRTRLQNVYGERTRVRSHTCACNLAPIATLAHLTIRLNVMARPCLQSFMLLLIPRRTCTFLSSLLSWLLTRVWALAGLGSLHSLTYFLLSLSHSSLSLSVRTGCICASASSSYRSRASRARNRGAGRYGNHQVLPGAGLPRSAVRARRELPPKKLMSTSSPPPPRACSPAVTA